MLNNRNIRILFKYLLVCSVAFTMVESVHAQSNRYSVDVKRKKRKPPLAERMRMQSEANKKAKEQRKKKKLEKKASKERKKYAYSIQQDKVQDRMKRHKTASKNYNANKPPIKERGKNIFKPKNKAQQKAKRNARRAVKQNKKRK